MPTLTGALAPSPLGGIVTPQVSANLRAYAVDYWPPHALALAATPAGTLTSALPVAANPRQITGAIAPSYLQDYYYRIHVIPQSIDLGNLLISQQRVLNVWNAWPDRSVQLDAIDTAALDNITLDLQGGLPITFTPLQERSFTVNISNDGAASINGDLGLVFADDPPLAVHFSGNRITAFLFGPSWGNGVSERLEWLSLTERSVNGDTTDTPLREYPRRSWEYLAHAEDADRQAWDAILYDASARTLAVPVWVDGSRLAADIAPGSLAIATDTTGLDYHPGGLACLRTNATVFEVVEVATVGAASLTLARPTLQSWPAGTELYPMRLVRLDGWPQLQNVTPWASQSNVRLVSMDANDWPAAMPPTLYRGVPVLDEQPEASTAPTSSYPREVELIDNRTGAVLQDDITGQPWPTQSHRWQKYGRAERAAHRSLLYALAGQVGRLWVPTWRWDLTPVSVMAGGGTTMAVGYVGYTNYLHARPGRRDIRVQLNNGSVFYRRITASIILDAQTEQLSVDVAWPSTIEPGEVLGISYMALSKLQSDTVELSHWTGADGAMACAVTFEQVTANG